LKSFLFLPFLILSLSLTSQAAETVDKAIQIAKDTKEQLAISLGQTKLRRENADYYALLNYSPFDLIVPSKFGVTLGSIETVDTTWELEYLKGSLSAPLFIQDLGSMSDARISVIKRSYSDRDSFNFSYGLSYYDFSLHLGDALLNRVTGGSYPSMDVVKIESLGFNLGLGNRWTFSKNVTLGVDWISWSQPVFVTNRKSPYLDHANNQEDRDDVDKAMKLISYFPRFTFLKVQLGILF